MYKIEVIRLGTGTYYGRPEGKLGSCGWSPHPWTLTPGKTPEQAKQNYIRNHKRYVK